MDWISPGAEPLIALSKFRKRKKISSLLGYVLHETWNWAFSRPSRAVTVKKSTKKLDARAKVLVLPIERSAFLTFSLPSPSRDLKVPNFLRVVTWRLFAFLPSTFFEIAVYQLQGLYQLQGDARDPMHLLERGRRGRLLCYGLWSVPPLVLVDEVDWLLHWASKKDISTVPNSYVIT